MQTQVSEVTGQGKTIEMAYEDACRKVMASITKDGQTGKILACTEFKKLSEFKPAQRTTKTITALKGSKKWQQVYSVYIKNEKTGFWMKAAAPSELDIKSKLNMQSYARDICLKLQCETCLRVERALLDDPNNQIEEIYMPQSINLGTWNFKIEYAIDSIPDQTASA